MKTIQQSLKSNNLSLTKAISLAQNRSLWRLVSLHTPSNTLCPKKTCDYIFYNNFNNKCPITIIFGTVSSKSMHHQWFHFPPHLSSATLPWEITEHKK